MLLDEVTGIPRWQTAVKALWDDGTIGDDVVVCTGSSAIDLQKGAAERLPGRRGAGRDHLVLGQSFASFASAIDSSIPPSPSIAIANKRRGASIPAAHALLERVLRSLGSRTDWSRMAREMDVPLGRRHGSPSYHTLRDYIELLAGGYFLLILYFWRAGGQTNNLSNEKKLYFADPLLHTIALDHTPGLAPNAPALIENAVGLSLYRHYEPPERMIESFLSPDRLHVWRTARAGEIDFVAGPRPTLDVVEVKYQRQIDLRGAAGVAKAHPGRPTVIATRDDLLLENTYKLIPAHLLLWALG